MKLEKGMLVSSDNWWYVVVEVVFKNGKTFLNCICDNANNIYAFEPNSIDNYLTFKEVGELGWGWPSREFTNDLKKRGIPYEVIVAALSGKHDDRF